MSSTRSISYCQSLATFRWKPHIAYEDKYYLIVRLRNDEAKEADLPSSQSNFRIKTPRTKNLMATEAVRRTKSVEFTPISFGTASDIVVVDCRTAEAPS